MSTGQVKRKQNPGYDNAHAQNDAAAPPTTSKKQRDNTTSSNTTTTPTTTTTKPKQHQPQFLDFSNDDNTVLLPRGPVATEQSTLPTKSAKKSTTTTNRIANEDDLFSSKKTQSIKMTDDDDGSVKDVIVDQIKKSKHDFTASQVKQRKIGEDGIEKPVHSSIKELALGEILFATITRITPFELKVSLPDGIVGTISYREITDTLTQQIDSCLESKLSDPTQVDIESLDNLNIFNGIPSLSELFTVGQQLTPMVINIVQSQTKKQKVLCSLRPSVVNAQYTQSLSLLPSCGVPLMGDIESIEEKGYVINYGLSFKGFVPFTSKITSETYLKGALVTTLLPRQRTITTSDRSIQVSLDSDRITHYAISMTTDLSFEQIRPGQFFRGVVSKHLKDGLVVQILGSFYVTISRTQLPPCSQSIQNFPLLHPCIVRIVSCRDTLNGKKIAATMRHDLAQPRSLYGSNLNFSTIAQLGDLKQVTVLRTIHGNKALLVKFHHDALGVALPDDYYTYKPTNNKDDDEDDDKSMKTTPILGFLSLPQCADVPLTDFPKQFKVGATITTRVTGFNYLDGVIQLTTKPSLLQAQAMTYEQIVGGEKYYGIVIATLSTDKDGDNNNNKTNKDNKQQRTIDNGIILQISPTVTAFIPIAQLSNRSAITNTTLLAKRYGIGSQHECRVLVCEPEKRKLIATLKPAMVERYGKDEVFKSYHHAKEVITAYNNLNKPLLLGGYVDSCTDDLVAVRFYNNILGIVTKAMLVEQGLITENQVPEYDIGQYLLTRVIGLTPDKKRLSLSLHIGSNNNNNKDETSESTLTPKEIAKAHNKTFFDTEPCTVGAVVPNVQITGSTKDYITLSFDISDRAYQAQLPITQLSDIQSNQFALFTKLTTKIAGTDQYPILSAAIVTAYNKDTNTAQLSIKYSTFFMHYSELATLSPTEIVSLLTPPKKITNPIQLINTTLSKFADKFASINTNEHKEKKLTQQRLTTLPHITMSSFKTPSLFAGTIISIEDQGLRIYSHSYFVAFVHKKHLTDVSYENIANVDLTTLYKIGQTVLFTEIPNNDDNAARKFYQLKTQPILMHYPTQFQCWEQYYNAVAEFESRILSIPNPLLTITNSSTKYVLGQTITNAKVSVYNTDNVEFTTPESIKSKLIIKCTNVEYHAPTITSTTIGSTMDITVIGIDGKTIYVTTLDRFKSKINNQNAQVTFPTSVIGTPIPATLISTSSITPTVSLSQYENNLLSLPTPINYVNLLPYKYYSNILQIGTTITIYPISTRQAIYIPYLSFKSQQTKTRVFAAGTFYDEKIQTQTDIKPDATFAVKLIGLYRGTTLIQPEDYTQLNDLSRCFIAAEFGAAGDNGTKSIAERFVAQISLSSLVDPAIPTVTKGKKSTQSTSTTTTTNVLQQLKTLLTTQNKKGLYGTTNAKIISQKTSTKTIFVPTFAKQPLHQIISYLSIRPTDLDSDDYQHRFQTENYKQGSVHNAVVLSFDDVTGIIAQVTPFLQVIIRPSACGVREVKKGKYESIPFDEVQKSIQIGDFITFKLQTDPVDQNNLTLLHGALIHNQFNPQGKDISTDPYTIAPSFTVTKSTQDPKPTKVTKSTTPKDDLSIGQIITGVTIIQYNEKSATYYVDCQGHRGEINLAEIVDYSDLDDNLATFNPTTYFSSGDILPKVIVLSSKIVDADKPPIYILSARLSRQDLIVPDIKTNPEITKRSQVVCKSLEQWAIDHKSQIINNNKPTTTKGKKVQKDNDNDDVQVEPIFDDITQDVLIPSHFVPNQFVLGYITAITKAGVFVQLSGLVSGLIKLSDLVDVYTDYDSIKSSSLYQIGQPLICRVRDVNTNGQVNLIAKPSIANLNDARIFASLVPGTVVSGIVKRVTDNGVFVTLKHSQNLDGLSYKTECVDDKSVAFQNYYNPGDKVKAVVLRVNKDERKISLGLKASLFTKLEQIKAKGGRTHEDTKKDKTIKGSLGMKKDTNNTMNDDDSSDDEFESTRQQRMAANSSDDDDSDDEDDKVPSKSKPMTNNIILQQQQKLNSTAEKEQKIISTLFTTTLTKKSTKSKSTMNDDDEEELIDFNVDSELTTRLNNNTIGTKHTNTKDSSERKIELLEHALVGLGDQSIMSTINSNGDLTIDQYEIQCASQPNNASVWISYMAYQLENNEIQKARDIVTKALKIMTVSALDQRWLIFSSLLSIEILFGTPTSLEQAVTKTAKEFDKIKVYSEVGRVAISSNKYPLAIDFYTKALRSSGLAQDKVTNQTKPRSILQQVQEIYIALISLQFAQSKRTESQQLLKQAIQQLPSQYSSYISVKTILLEYQSQHGSLSTGRTMFQMFLKDNVKRIDVWTTWIQQEIKVCKKLHQYITQNSNTVTQAKKNEFKQQKTRVRELFDIFTTKAINTYNITWSTFKPVQIQPIYALAIEFENSPPCLGDSRTEIIKDRAKIYVDEVSTM